MGKSQEEKSYYTYVKTRRIAKGYFRERSGKEKGKEKSHFGEFSTDGMWGFYSREVKESSHGIELSGGE